MNFFVEFVGTLMLGMVCTSSLIGLWYLMRPILIRLRCPELLHGFSKLITLSLWLVLFCVASGFLIDRAQGSMIRYRLATPSMIAGCKLLFVIWLLGALYHFRKLHQNWRALKKSIREAYPAEPIYQRCLQQVCKTLQVKPERIQLYRMKAIPCGCTVGIFHPKIFLPEGELSANQAYLTILHEMIHQQHGDLWISLGITITAEILWFNPLIRRFQRDARAWNEILCDYAVCEETDALQEYFSFLIEMAINGDYRSVCFQHSLSEGYLQLKRRIEMTGKLRREKRRSKLAKAAAVLSCAMLSLTAPLLSVHTVAWGYELLYDATVEERIADGYLIIWEKQEVITDNSGIDPAEYANSGIIFRDVLPVADYEMGQISLATASAETKAVGQLDFYLDAEELKACASFKAKSDENLAISGNVYPSTAVFRMGYVAPDGVRYCMYVTGNIQATFPLSQNGTHVIYAVNDTSGQIHVSATYGTYKRLTE